MGLKEILSRVESEARHRLKGDDAFCQHLQPVVVWPSGSGEIEKLHASCDCGLPRLRIVVSYQDRARWLRTVVGDIVEAWRAEPSVGIEERTRWGAEDYAVDFDELMVAVQNSIGDLTIRPELGQGNGHKP